MSCCFSSHILTRAEREAIARLREQRATGRAPIAATHRALHHSHQDPIVTFYTNKSLVKRLTPPKPRTPRPIKPARHPRPANQPIQRSQKPKTAHQKKKHMRQAAKRIRPNPDDPRPLEKAPPPVILVERLRNIVVRDNAKNDMNTVNTAPSTPTAPNPPSASNPTTTTEDTKENSIHRFRAATKKHFENVKNKFGNSPIGERFVLQQSPIAADTSESNMDDQYFQDLMKSEL